MTDRRLDRRALHGRVAMAFVAGLLEELSPQSFDEMRRANAMEPDPNICHSHDYCDANMVMLAAVESCDGPTDIAGPEYAALHNGAWEFAGPALGRKRDVK